MWCDGRMFEMGLVGLQWQAEELMVQQLMMPRRGPWSGLEMMGYWSTTLEVPDTAELLIEAPNFYVLDETKNNKRRLHQNPPKSIADPTTHASFALSAYRLTPLTSSG